MKIKFLIGCAALLFSISSLNAQKARLTAGVNFANVSISDNGKVDDAKMLTDFHAGFLFDIPLVSILHLQPGVLYTAKGSKTESGDESSLNYSRATSNPSYVEIPLNFILKTPAVKSTRFFAGAGPYIAVGVGGKIKNRGRLAGIAYDNERDIEFSDDDPTTLDYEEGAGFGVLKRFDYGLNGTAGIEGKNLVLSVNYGLGLAKLQSGSNSSANDNNKHRVLGVSLGIKL